MSPDSPVRPFSTMPIPEEALDFERMGAARLDEVHQRVLGDLRSEAHTQFAGRRVQFLHRWHYTEIAESVEATVRNVTLDETPHGIFITFWVVATSPRTGVDVTISVPAAKAHLL